MLIRRALARTRPAIAAGALVAIVAGLLVGPLASVASAAPLTFDVNQSGNQSDGAPDGICDTNVAAGLQCTLRGAIQEANFNAGPDTITFSLASPYRIQPSGTALPVITSPVTINGTSLPGYNPVTGVIVRVDGTTIGGDGLVVGAGGGGTTIRGLEIVRWANGIRLSSDGSTVAGNYIGLRGDSNVTCNSPTGACANTQGVTVQDGSSNVIGGTTAGDRNVISNNYIAVWVTTLAGTAANNAIRGNYIGTDHTGTVARSNSFGVYQYSTATEPTGTVIGGTAVGARNVVSANTDSALEIGAGTATIQGNYLGVDATGGVDLGNGGEGVQIYGPAHDVLVGGATAAARNVMSGNTQEGIEVGAYIGGASNIVIQGNYIGTDSTGAVAVQNDGNGIYYANSSVATITGNVVAGNYYDNIGVYGCLNCVPATGLDIDVTNNIIGLAADGATALGNGYHGLVMNNVDGATVDGNTISGHIYEGFRCDACVDLTMTNNMVGTDVTGELDRGNTYGAVINSTVGGDIGVPGGGNVFSGNSVHGLLMDNGSASLRVRANFAGTDDDGESAIPNDQYGIAFSDADTNVVGGTTAADRNVISGNLVNGVALVSADDNQVIGNYIGVGADGTTVLGNGYYGIGIDGGSERNIIGSTQAGGGNVIANTVFGVGVGVQGRSNEIRGNAIDNNATLAIDLADNGVTLNDPLDSDIGPNRFQNFPVITSSGSNPGGTQVKGTLASRPNRTYDVDVFETPVCDGSGNGEAAIYLGSTQVVTDGSGNASFVTTVAAQVAGGAQVVATATDQALGDTSEVSACVANVGVPTLSISPATQTVSENVGNAAFTVSISGAPTLSPVTVDVATSNGTATAGSDYTAVSTTLTFLTGASQIVNVPVTDDVLDEDALGETFTVTLSNADNAFVAPGASQSVTTISDNDVTPQFTISPVSVTVAEGVANASFNVTLSGNPLVSPATVQVNTANGTATAGSDYTAVSTTLSFLTGSTQVVNVPITDDVVDEDNIIGETFTITLSSPTNAVLGATIQSTGTITDNDTTPEFTISPATLTVGEAAGPAALSVTLSGNPLVSPATVQVTTANGTATSGTDYTAVSTTLTFLTGSTQVVNVPITNDTADEADETFTVTLSSPTNSVLGATSQSTVTISDNDAAPVITVTQPPITTEGAVTQTFTLTLTPASGKTVTVLAATEAITATEGLDYLTTAELVTFLPGQTSKTVVVSLLGDAIDELQEQYRLDLFSPTDATIGAGAPWLGRIADDDPQPTLSITDVTAAEGDAGTVSFIFTVSLSAPSGREIKVSADKASGTATTPSDFKGGNRRLVFLPGTTTATFTLQVKGDTLIEPDEVFFVNLSNPLAASIADNQGLGTILNDDP